MVDAATKKTVAAIPQHKTKAGPRDGDQWVIRLKEEYMSLIKVFISIFTCNNIKKCRYLLNSLRHVVVATFLSSEIVCSCTGVV